MLYQVCRGDQTLMQTTVESCRYPGQLEADMLSVGYEIYLDGKKLKGTRKSGKKYEEGKSNA